MMTSFARWMTIALVLAACDPGTRSEIESLRAEVAAQGAMIGALRGRVDALETGLAAERDARSRGEVEIDARLRASPAAPAQVEIAGAPGLAEAEVPVTCAADRCTLPRAAFDALMANPAALTRAARVVPHMQNGESHGFKLFGIRPRSPFASIGLKNGDVVTELGGKSLGNIEDALAAYTSLRARSEWTIKGERAGAPFSITVAIEG